LSQPDVLVAVDLGASSGRIYVGHVDEGVLHTREVHRFPNGGVEVLGHLFWDVLGIYRGVLEGLRRISELGVKVVSIGIDSWAVDYGLLDSKGELVANPYHHRDMRTKGVAESVLAQVGAQELYQRNGIAPLPFNTVFQLVADRHRLEIADGLLLIPDLLSYWLTGNRAAELTNASTTGLLCPDGGSGWAWDEQLMGQLEIPARLFPPLLPPGSVLGGISPAVYQATGIKAGTPVVAVASHDTASAVAGTPAEGGTFAFVSSGTWSLIGLELTHPIKTEPARLARFTNELGADATVMFLRNVMGLWLLQECERSWGLGAPEDLSALLQAASALAPRRWLIDVDDPVFLPPGGMPQRLAAACEAAGLSAPTTPPELARCVVDSLAVAYLRSLETATSLAGQSVSQVHLVGGGSQNTLLCQLTADASGLPVVAGPVEAAVAGNLLVQGRTMGLIDGGLSDLRHLLRGSANTRTYYPQESVEPWLEAAGSLERRCAASAPTT